MKTTKTISIHKSTFLMLSLLFTFFFTSNIKAQNIQVKGIVKGKAYDKIEALNGANIFLKGTKIGTSSNKKGEFTFPKKLKVGDVLVFSYLGYLKKAVNIKANSTYLTVTLNEDDNEMLGALNSNKRYKSKHKKQ